MANPSDSIQHRPLPNREERRRRVRQSLDDPLLTPLELEALTTLSRTTIWRRVRDGKMPPPIRLTPTRIGWRRSAIDAWLAGQGSVSG